MGATILDRLRPCCAGDGQWPPPRSWQLEPWTLMAGGRRWAGASDGHVIAASALDVPADLDDLDAEDPRAAPSVRAFLEHPVVAGAEVPISALRAWAGDPAPPEVPCPACRERPVPCPACQDAPEASCEECWCDPCGATRTVAPPQARGWLGPQLLDRVLLARALAAVATGARCRVEVNADPLGPIHVAGEGWHVVLMPMRPAAGSRAAERRAAEVEREAPRFEVGA